MKDSVAAPSAPSPALLAAIIDSSWVTIVSKDLSGTVTSWNPAAARMFGYSAQEMIGQSIRKIIPDELQAEEDTILDRIANGQHIPAFRAQRLHADGRRIMISAALSPIFDAEGKVIGASKLARDVSNGTEMAVQLRDSEELFRMLADNIPQLAWMADATGYVYWYNQRWYDFTGTTLADMKGWGWTSVHHPDHVDRVTERIQLSWDTGEEWEDTFPLRGADGQYRWFLSRAKAIRDTKGKVVCWFGTNTDINEERSQQEQIRLLMREVNHRSKNMLAMIQSLARRTAPSDNQAFIDRFELRIQALAANQDLLMNRQWRFVEISKLVRAQLYLVDDLLASRITLTGPELMINPAPAETIGLAIHELATNAAKYGALSNTDGRLDLSWGVDETAAGDARFWIDWREHGGPPVTPPRHDGFGSTVIRRMPQMSLAADVTLAFEPAGAHWRLECSADTVLHGAVNRAGRRDTAIPATEVGFGPLLLVEDEPILALDLLHELTRAGYWVIGPATTIAAAQDLINRQKPLCVLLDVRLGDGETTAGLARSLADEGIPFIVLSGFMGEELEPEFSGAPLLGKPVASKELLAMMSRMLPRPAQDDGEPAR